MVTFEAVGTGGKDQLHAAVNACCANGVTVDHQEEIPSRGIFMLKAASPDARSAQAAIAAAAFSLVLFD